MDIINDALCEMWDFVFYDYPTASITATIFLLALIITLVIIFWR